MNPRTYLPTALLLVLCSCAATGKGGNAAPAHAPGGDTAAKDDSKAEALQKKERELNYAKLQLQITELELQADERSQKNSIADAERGVRHAEEELADYLQTHKVIETKERELNTDQQKENLRETQQEYDELESMYKGEDFAKKTKELVLSRGKARLDFSARNATCAMRSTRRAWGSRTAAPRRSARSSRTSSSCCAPRTASTTCRRKSRS